MPKVKVIVTKITDMSFPIFVECELEDCQGVKHYFIDKAPVLIGDYEFSLPCDGYIECNIISKKENVLLIDTSLPWDIESTNGEYQFEVNADKIVI